MMGRSGFGSQCNYTDCGVTIIFEVMATLTEVSFLARNAIKWGFVSLVIVMLIPGIYSTVRNYYLQANPPPPPLPTVKYGKLPLLDFPLIEGQATPEYKLETIEGGLPTLPNVARVYITGINKSRLLSLDRLRFTAKRLGFTGEPLALNEQVYRFIHPAIPAEITANIITSEFAYRFDWTTEKTIYSSHQIPLAQTAVAEAKAFFRNLGILPTDLDGGPAKYQYLTATGSALIPVDQFHVEEANFVRVDIWRAEKEKLKFVSTGGDTSPVNVMISGIGGNKRVVQANIQYSEIEDTEFATYPLKNVNAAWQELVGGKGFVAKSVGKNVVVRKAYLAYFESNRHQEFLQPVFVFEGDGGFMGFVQAVSSEYLHIGS